MTAIPSEVRAMRSHHLQTTAVVLALFAGYANAQAPDQAPPQQAPQPLTTESQQSGADRALQTVPGKNGAEEPTSHSTSTSSPDGNAVLVNGALNVPGAPSDGPTVPAKYSEKNAADDKLITVAHTVKTLPADQRQAIYEALKRAPAASAPPAALNAEVGTELPPAVELRAIPEEVANRFPQIKDYQYAVADGRVLLVSPPTRIVVGIFPDFADQTTGGGRRIP